MGGWLLAAFLLLGILLPTGCVLWFMNQAAQSQAESARRTVAEAFRGQLRLARQRVEAYWQPRAAALERDSDPWTLADFPRLLAATGAGSVLLFDSNGQLAYPGPPPAMISDPTLTDPRWQRARSLELQRDNLRLAAMAYEALAGAKPKSPWAAVATQAQVRCLTRSGQNQAAVSVILSRFRERPAELDSYGRVVAVDEMLLALQLMGNNDRRFPGTAQTLAAWLRDYTIPIPAAQRLFAMTELHSLAPDHGMFPTYAAERLAAESVAAELARPGSPGLEKDPALPVWRLTGRGGRAVALYGAEPVSQAMAQLLADFNRDSEAHFTVTPPGAAESDDSVDLGSLMPGWRVSVSLPSRETYSEAARRRRTAYLWAGYLTAAAIAFAGLLAGQALYRQQRLARLKSDLVTTVSHELRTPLASMRLLVETLLEDGCQDQKTIHEYLELIAGENLRLSRLIENFLTFSRMERKRQKFHFAETTIDEVVKSALLSIRERLRDPACQVDVDVPAELPLVRADRDALVTVLLNLLDNAFKYTGPEKRISLRASHEEGRVALRVTDNGLGIAPRDQKRIFRRFYRVDQRLARETQGCGLGLSIVEFIVRTHGGEVKVESGLGTGSTFLVLLPCQDAAREALA